MQLKFKKVEMASFLLKTMFFNLAKIVPMNLEVVIILIKQISKLYIFAADLLKQNIWDKL